MRFLKIYGGVILILASVITLFVCFTAENMDKGIYNWSLIGCAVVIILGVLLCVFGGKSADKIGGK